MENRKSKSITVFIIFFAIFLVMVIAVMAKYADPGTKEEEVRLEDFEVALEPSPDNGALASDGTITLDVDEYKKFVLNLGYKGYGKSYVRVLIEESWIYEDLSTEPPTQTVLFNPGSSTEYDFGSSIKYNDGYLYINGIVPDDVPGGAYTGSYTIPVITKVKSLPSQLPTYTDSTGVTKDATHVKLSIKVEAVQYNRAEVIWGIALPIT